MSKPVPFLHPPLDPTKFATIKYQWEDLRDIIDNNKFPIWRHVDQETTYRLYSQKLKQEWKSVYDFVLHTKFNFGKRLVQRDNGGHRGSSIQSVEEYDYESIVKQIPTLPEIPSPPRGHVWESYDTYCAVNNNMEQEMDSQRLLAKNDFPYYMEDGIEHWCLWKLGGNDVNDADINWAKEELNKNGNITEMMHWINPVHLKSLPDIDHAHIVCLIKR